jgi:hypothetical protein
LSVDDVLLVLVVVLVIPTMLLMTGGLWAGTSLRRANKVAPGRSVGAAPLRWLWSPGEAASLHRRLRAACQLAGSVIPQEQDSRRWAKRRRKQPTDAITLLAGDVVEEAVQLDRELVSTSWMARGLPKSQALAALSYRVKTVEDAARRVHELAARRTRIALIGNPTSLSLDERITAMEAAFHELTPRPPAV